MWEERKHPRDESGQFTSGSGSSGGGKTNELDKWSEKTGYSKESHVAYIDTNKQYSPSELLDIVQQSEDWDVSGSPNEIILKNKNLDSIYVYDKKTGKVEMTTEDELNERGEKAHTEELSNYVDEYLKSHNVSGDVDKVVDEIFQASPYSLHSYEKMNEIIREKYNPSKGQAKSTEDEEYEKARKLLNF